MGLRAINAILSESWAIRPEALENMLTIASRENEFAGQLEALESKLGRPLGGTERGTVRDGVALIPVSGPLFRYANLFTAISGATSYDMLATDFEQAMSDPNVRAVVLQIDSPGGEVNGASELASLIAGYRGKKPIVAYGGGTIASAAYWIASAADRIVASDTAIIGSIGVMSGMTMRDPKPGEKSFTFVSSQSPNKNASPATDSGAAAIQRVVDDLAQVFVDTVARNRGTDAETVLANYGQGAVFVGADALARGMIDETNTFEGLMSSLSTEVNAMDYSKLTAQALAEHRPDLVKAIGDEAVVAATADQPDLDAVKAEARAEGATAERERLAGIEALAMPGTEALVAELKADASMTPERAALKILQAARAAGGIGGAQAGAHLSNLRATEGALNPPAAGTGEDQEPSLDEAVKAATALARKAGIDA